MVTAETLKKIASTSIVKVIYNHHSTSELRITLVRSSKITEAEWVARFKRYEGKKRVTLQF